MTIDLLVILPTLPTFVCHFFTCHFSLGPVVVVGVHPRGIVLRLVACPVHVEQMRLETQMAMCSACLNCPCFTIQGLRLQGTGHADLFIRVRPETLLVRFILLGVF